MEGEEDKVCERGKRISQRGEQRRMERERERGLGGRVESKKKKKKKRVSSYSFQHCTEPLLAACGGPLGQAGSVRMHLSIFATSLWGGGEREREQGERLLSIISTKEQTEGK